MTNKRHTDTPRNGTLSQEKERGKWDTAGDEGNIRFEILSKAINDAIWDWNMVDGTLNWNHGLFAIYGYDPEQEPHTIDSWKSNIHPDDREAIVRELEDTLSKRINNWTGLYRYRCRNGNYKFTYDRGYILYRDSEPVRMMGAMQDIDERMVALREIEKLSLVASNTDNLVLITDPEEKIEWVNHAFVKRTGYSLPEIIGQTPRFLQGPDTDPEVLDRIRLGLRQQTSVTEEILNYTKDGSKFWLRLNINPVFDAANKLVKFVAVETDITMQKEYEGKITAIATDLTNLIETANAPIVGLDRDGNINEYNQRAVEILGHTKDEVIGRNFLEKLVGENSRGLVAEKIREVYNGTPFGNLEVPMITREEKQVVILLNATPRKTSHEEVENLFLVGQDITEFARYRQSLEERVKERTQELQAALKKEKELVSVKSRFASIVSHEFRTPLSTISLSANHIKKFKSRLQPEDIDKKLDVIQQQVGHMTKLLEDVLTIGKSEAGKIEISRKKLNLATLIGAIKEDVENQFKNTHRIEAGLELSGIEVFSDEGLLRNILVNLLSNAIKYSPGRTTVFLDALETGTLLEIKVRDEGIGIPEADQQRIFSPFDRGTNVSAIPGSGLGLSIVKKAVDLIGGTIEFISRPGKGTTFTVKLPLH